MNDSFWLNAFLSIVRVEGHDRTLCECPQCSADDGEEMAIYFWNERRHAEMWDRYIKDHPDGLPHD